MPVGTPIKASQIFWDSGPESPRSRSSQLWRRINTLAGLLQPEVFLIQFVGCFCNRFAMQKLDIDMKRPVVIFGVWIVCPSKKLYFRFPIGFIGDGLFERLVSPQ